MSDKFFIDTNVIAYGFEGKGMKSRVSRLVMGLALESADAAMVSRLFRNSATLLCENLPIGLRRQLHDYLRLALFPLCKVSHLLKCSITRCAYNRCTEWIL
jgi:hypothetical protein